MDILGTLFGNPARVKILRLFLLNPLSTLSVDDVTQKSKVRRADTRREIALLKKIGFLAEKIFVKEMITKRGSKEHISKKHTIGFQTKQEFPLLVPLKNLILTEAPLNRDEIVRMFRATGKVKLLILAGIFIDEADSRVDVLVVGDNLKKRAIESTFRSLEAEIGKELSYSALDTADFLYRLSVYDKFVRDVLDFRHERVIDTLNVS